MEQDRTPPARVWRLLLALGLFVLAVAVRGLGWPMLRFAPFGIQPFGGDAYYHLRRIEHALAHFPRVLELDSYLNFPNGGQPIWTPVFDFLLALLARPFAAPDGGAPVWLLVWVPPLLGGITVLLTARIGREQFGRAAGLLSGVLLAILPAHAWYSQIGFLDQHVAVALMTAILLWLHLQVLAAAPGDPLRSAGLGAGLAAALLLWPGMLLHVAIVESALLGLLLAAPSAHVPLHARSLVVANAVAAVLLLPLSAGREWLVWGSFSPVVLTSFQPWLMGAAAVTSAALAALWSRHGAPERAGPRLIALLVGGFACAALSAALIPELRGAPGQILGWFLRDETFQSLVTESRPILSGADGLGLGIAHGRLSYFFLLVPLLGGALVLGAQGRERVMRSSIAWWVLVLFAATLAQRRFFNSFSVPYVLVVAWALCELDRRALAGLPRARRAAGRALLVVATLALLAPIATSYALGVRNLARGLRGQTLHYTLFHQQKHSLVHTAHWLRTRSPATSGYRDGVVRPEYGVLGSWGEGHALRYIARRAPIVDAFGDDVAPDNFRLAEAYFSAEDEDAALGELDRLPVRYVLLGPRGSGQRAEYAPASLFKRLHRARGSQAKAGTQRLDALHRHRLRFESPFEDPDGRPWHSVYEIVPGARLEGVTEPQATVEVTLDVAADTRFRWRASAQADADGRFSLRVPYAAPARGVVRTGLYRVRAPGLDAEVPVAEEAIANDGVVVVTAPGRGLSAAPPGAGSARRRSR